MQFETALVCLAEVDGQWNLPVFLASAACEHSEYKPHTHCQFKRGLPECDSGTITKFLHKYS